MAEAANLHEQKAGRKAEGHLCFAHERDLASLQSELAQRGVTAKRLPGLKKTLRALLARLDAVTGDGGDHEALQKVIKEIDAELVDVRPAQRRRRGTPAAEAAPTTPAPALPTDPQGCFAEAKLAMEEYSMSVTMIQAATSGEEVALVRKRAEAALARAAALVEQLDVCVE